MKKAVVVLIAVSLSGASLAAVSRLGEAERGALSLVLYQSNFALVKDERKAALAKGPNSLEVEGVAQTLRPDSVIVGGKGLEATAISFNGERLSLRHLLYRNIGREATVVFAEPGGIRRERATLLSLGEEAVWNIGGRVAALPLSGFYGSPVAYYEFDSAPEGVGGKPILKIDADCAGDCGPVGISYQADGLGWEARYSFVMDEKTLAGPLSGWAVMHNSSGVDFDGSAVTLMAGDVERERVPMQADYALARSKAMAMEAAPAPASASPAKKLEYYSIEMPRPVTIQNGETRQERFSYSPSVKAVKTLKIERLNYSLDRPVPEEREIHPEITLKIENTTENGLGTQLPAGIFRIYASSEGDREIFLGEDRAQGSGKGGKIELNIGRAFDITAERRTVSSRRIDQWTSEAELEMVLKNGGEARMVEVAETFGGRFKILEASHSFEQRDADTVVFKVEAPKEGSATLRLKARLELYH